MKIAMTLTCRDEITLIRTHIEYHRPKVDLIIVTDNASGDGTRSVLEELKGPDLIVIDEPALDHSQYLWVSRMISMAKDLGVDWILNSDADEFFMGDIRSEILRVVSEGYNCLDIPWYNFIPTWRDRPDELLIPRRLLWRLGGWQKDSKAAHSTAGFQHISEGNHVVFMDNKKSAGRARGVRICHYSNQGWFPWRNKMIRAGQAYEQNKMIPDFLGSHVRLAYKSFLEGGDDALYKLYLEHFASDDEDIEKMGLVFDPRLAIEFGLKISNIWPIGEDHE